MVHPVDVQQGAGVVDQGGEGRHVGPGAEDVRRRRQRHQSGPLREHGRQVVDPQLGRVRVEVDPADGRTDRLGGLHPRPHVRVVVEPAHDDLVAGTPGARERPRHVVGQVGHAAPDHHAGRIGAEQVGQRGAAAGHDLVGRTLRRGMGAAVRDRAGHRGGDGVGHGPRHLRPAGTVEERLATGQRGVVGPDRCHVVRHDRLPSSQMRAEPSLVHVSGGPSRHFRRSQVARAVTRAGCCTPRPAVSPPSAHAPPYRR